MTLDARRLVRALLVAAAVAVATGGTVVGLAAAQAEPGLFVPEPRPGDRATYRVQQVVFDDGAARADLSGMREASFEWLPATTAFDRDTTPRSVQPLLASYLFHDDVYPHKTLYDAATGTPLADLAEGSDTATDGMHYGIVLEDLVGSDGSTMRYTTETFRGPLGPCGARLALPAAPGRGDLVPIAGHCDWPGGDDVVLFRAVGWRDVGRTQGYLFVGAEEPRLRVWYDGESTFPLRVEAPLTDTVAAEYTFGRLFVLDRVAFERGDTPYPPAGQGVGLGPAGSAARTPWGIDDRGVQHPFPLAQAYRVAVSEQDPPGAQQMGNDATVPDFLASHPDAYVGYAVYTDLVDQQGEHHHTWWILFTDGEARLGKRVELGPVGFSNAVLPSRAGLVEYVYDWDPGTTVDAWRFPAPDRLPGTMPTARDMMARHDAASPAKANGYGFQQRCATEACDEVLTEGVAGRFESDLGGALLVVGGSVVEHRSANDASWFADDGRLARRYTLVSNSDTPIPVVRSAVGEEPAGPAAGSRPSLASVTAASAAPAAVGASLIALAASALYYFWPTLKGGIAGLGLFSRIEDDRVLDHPTRRRVHDAVCAEPGIHFQALARKAALGRGALDHHLRKLVAAGLVTVRRSPGYTCYFPKGRLDRHLLDAAPAVRSDGSKAVLQAVAALPGTSSRDLAAHLGLAPSTVSYHLKRLQAAGLVQPGEVGVRLTPLGTQTQAAA